MGWRADNGAEGRRLVVEGKSITVETGELGAREGTGVGTLEESLGLGYSAEWWWCDEPGLRQHEGLCLLWTWRWK